MTKSFEEWTEKSLSPRSQNTRKGQKCFIQSCIRLDRQVGFESREDNYWSFCTESEAAVRRSITSYKGFLRKKEHHSVLQPELRWKMSKLKFSSEKESSWNISEKGTKSLTMPPADVVHTFIFSISLNVPAHRKQAYENFGRKCISGEQRSCML